MSNYSFNSTRLLLFLPWFCLASSGMRIMEAVVEIKTENSDSTLRANL